MKTHYIDAKGKVLGRLASKIAILLSGKNNPDYVPYLDKGDKVVVRNVELMKITGKKMQQKKYYRHSGYPGGLKVKTLEEIFQKNPAEVLKRAVYNMLPKNKLRKLMLKRLEFEDTALKRT